jgi:hypothetical protein
VVLVYQRMHEHIAEGEFLQSVQRGERSWQLVQRVRVHLEHTQRGQLTNCARESGQVVVDQVERLQVLQIADLVRERAQSIVREIQVCAWRREREREKRERVEEEMRIELGESRKKNRKRREAYTKRERQEST